MCNLYAVATTQDELRRVMDALDVDLGNFDGMTSVFPDGIAPVLRLNTDGARRLERMRWGFPKLEKPGATINTNARNLASSYWRPWLKPEFRVLVPATAFSEYMPEKDPATGRRPAAWFAVKDGTGAARPLFAFAGVWRPWTGTRGPKSNSVTGEHRLFAFATTEANSIVKPIHPKAMPVILTPDKWQRWLTAPVDEALTMQQPLPDDQLHIVRVGPLADRDEPEPAQPALAL